MSATLPLEQSPDVSKRRDVSPEAVFSQLEARAPFVESCSVKEQNGITVDPFIVDMALWQILKRGKPSDDAGRDKFVVKKTGSKNFPGKVQCGIAGDVNVHQSLFCNVAAQGLENQTSFCVNTPLLSSGLSPPLA